MNTAKKITVNYSSLVGLKAELLRKHAEVQDAKAKIDPITISKPKVKRKKNKVKQENQEKSNVTEIEDLNALKKSKYMLEAKSRLYEKLKKNGDKDQQYLVDFSNKSDESEDEIYREEDYDDDVNSDPEEDWVEYKDCFGRTRKCLRKDLPKMKEKDNVVKREIVKEPEEKKEIRDEEKYRPPIFIAPEKEPEIEMMRKKWEEQTERLSHKHDIHYQDVLFDEARSHGVGYYAFSQDEEERAKQQSNLSKLRKETEQRQKEMQEITELKMKMENNRLKAARVRQRIRAGLPAEPEEEQENILKPSENEAIVEVSLESKDKSSLVSDNGQNPVEQVEENSLAVIEDKIRAFGELLGKRPKFRELSQEEWVHKRRNDRHGEFAPTYENFISGGHLKITRENQVVERHGDEEDPIKINAAGPEPTDLWESEAPDKDHESLSVEKVEATDENFETDIIGPFPPPSFFCSVPPPPITNFNLTKNEIISPLQAFISSPPPPLFNPLVNPLNVNCATLSSLPETVTGQNNNKVDESDSDDSEIIGPMPPSGFEVSSGNSIAEIPLPSDSVPNETDSQNLSSDKISAGLKFLRQKFDKNDKN